MSPENLDAAERALSALGHLDVLAVRDGADGLWGLGRLALKAFAGEHARELAELEIRLTDARAPRELALRGRVRRLRGDARGARADLSRAAVAAPRDARTLAWLGEFDATSAPRRALKLLARATALDPDDGHARLWLGSARLEARQYAAARRDFDAALLRFARPPYILLLLRGVVLMHLRDFANAARAAERAVADEPSIPAGHVLLSNARQRQGKKAAALAACHRARDLDLEVGASFLLPEFGVDPWKNAARYLKRLDRAIRRRPSALLLAERGELKRDPSLCLYSEAQRDYERAARLSPKSAWILALVGRARNNAAGGEAGLEDFNRAVVLCPDSGWIRAWRGAVLARLGRAGAAYADFDAARRLMSWYPYTCAWRGALLVRDGRYAEACADLDRALVLDPNYAFTRFERFKARLGLGEYEGAVEDLAAARRVDPKFDWPGLRRGEPGRERLEKAVRLRPDLGWLRAWRGRALADEGRLKRALPELDTAVRMLPREADPRVWRAEASARLGRFAASRRDLDAAILLAPGGWSAHKALADLHASQGKLHEALAAMRRVTALARTTVAHLVERARLEMRLDRPREALRSLERALELDSGYSEARALSARVRWTLGDLLGAERDAEAALSSPAAPAIAFVVRGSLRGARGDARGQAADFRRAVERDPSLFTAEERSTISRAA